MFHHFDVVTPKKSLPAVDLPLGAEGTVIRLFDRMNPIVYDVIFHDANHKSQGALHVWGDEAPALKRAPLQELKGLK